MKELRCGGTMHGRLDEDLGLLEVKCGRRSCGAAPGVVVLHTFDIHTGELTGTARFRQPPKEGTNDDDCNQRAAVRSA